MAAADNNNNWRYGHLHLIDELKNGDPRLGGALSTYAHHVDINRQSRHWKRTVTWMENIFFGLGRHYIDDILVSRLSRDTSTGDLSIVREQTRNVPRPTNDLLGRYIETNIALFTENRPRPRITSKSDAKGDIQAAQLSELTIEYLWEALEMPEKHREIARLLLYCGVCWLEVVHDELEPRILNPTPSTPQQTLAVPGDAGQIVNVNLPRETTTPQARQGKPQVEFGDITTRVISPFEMHLPVVHWWNGPEMEWVMREYYVPIDILKQKYGDSRLRGITNKNNGYYLDNLDKIGGYNVQNLPLWWWERLTDVVEGPGPSLYVGTPETWSGFAVVRILDRKPNPTWPKGRTVIVAGDQVIYDSPKDKGARAYDPRWPSRWHPYVRYRWEPQPGSVYGRSLVSKLLPKLKRVNAIDTTLIMWRRTVPIASWIMPKGTSVVEDLHSGRPGMYVEFDPRRTMNAKPEPIFPPNYPSSAIEERQTQIAEMESIAGTEEILRGQRPVGVNSAAMLDALRKQALASRSAILQAWDESLQVTGTSMLQEVIKNIRNDPRYAERIRILAREKDMNRLAIEKFSGTDLSDNVIVRVDTASMAMLSREAKQARALEFLQYSPNFIQLPLTLREKVLDWLGFDADLRPQGPDVNRAKDMIQWIKDGNFQYVIPFPEDDPYVFHELLSNEMKTQEYLDWPQESQVALIQLIELYRQQVELIEKQKIAMQQQMAMSGAAIAGAAQGPPGGGK